MCRRAHDASLIMAQGPSLGAKEHMRSVAHVLRTRHFSFFVIYFLLLLLLLRYIHVPTPLDDSTRPLHNSTNSTLHDPQRADALVTSIILDGGPHGWVPVNTHSTPVLPKWEEAVGSSQSTTPTWAQSRREWKVHAQHGSVARHVQPAPGQHSVSRWSVQTCLM